jgi:hypothetical protein
MHTVKEHLKIHKGKVVLPKAEILNTVVPHIYIIIEKGGSLD